MSYIIPVVICYMLGSVTFSFVVGRLLKGIDIRKHGSGNAGATNTLRVMGVGPAIAVLLLDAAKGVLAVWIGRWFVEAELWVSVLCGIAAIAGHNWPIFFGFKGGKGIATTIGVTMSLCFLPALYAGILAIIAIGLTRYVSVGSLLFTSLLPILLVVMGRPMEIWIGSIAIGILAIIRHRSNIMKLLQGAENKIGAKRQM